ncbi:MAG: glycosyltransferase [Planctomycetaceae bacterium]|nr:glycosyltransferase [Planctomycetaceae bacterium]
MSRKAKKDSQPSPEAAPAKAQLFEIAWEVCQQVGGIYTVLRSKTPYMVERWGEHYCLIGPWNEEISPLEFEELRPGEHVANVIQNLAGLGIIAHYGRWLVTGQPRTILLDLRAALGRLAEIRYRFWRDFAVHCPVEPLFDEVIAFGWSVEQFFRFLMAEQTPGAPVIAHFHEWMGGAAIPALRAARLGLSIVFTTHATLLGRYLASSDLGFYNRLAHVNWLEEARGMNIEPHVKLERAAAHGAHVLTTLSQITADECEHLLGRRPTALLPNGLNIERFVAMHEFQNLHLQYKERINHFVMGEFFPSYTFDLENTLYFFSAGRYEYRNKGYDLTLECMARLNSLLQGSDRTVVFFLITRQPFRSINAEVLNRIAMLDELERNCQAIRDQIGQRLFQSAAAGHMPDYNALVDDYWRLRLKRLLHARKSHSLPTIVTHDLVDDQHDEVLNQLRYLNLVNGAADRVKVIYHPDFVNANNPLWGMDYDQFVRGCHLGIFPSFYEPWGYTPLECVARGIPAVTSDLSGFGSYVSQAIPEHDDAGIYVVPRRGKSFEESAQQLAGRLLQFCRMDRRQRIAMRNQVERTADQFDWTVMCRHYDTVHRMAATMND